MNNKKVGVILAGCGVYDGTEIHEAVATLVALENHGLEAICFAPDIEQMHVVNHITGQPIEGEKRNVLIESARIARGAIFALTPEATDPVDALVFPGGFGAAKNLSNYAVCRESMEVNPIVAEVIKKARNAGKPIAALCIAPVILASVFNDQTPVLTLGANGDAAKDLENIGAKHQVTTHEEVVVDKKLKLVTAPCYMLNATIGQVIRGADMVVQKLKDLL